LRVRLEPGRPSAIDRFADALERDGAFADDVELLKRMLES